MVMVMVMVMAMMVRVKVRVRVMDRCIYIIYLEPTYQTSVQSNNRQTHTWFWLRARTHSPIWARISIGRQTA